MALFELTDLAALLQMDLDTATANRAHPPPPNLFPAFHLQSPGPPDPDGCADCGFR